MSLPFRLSRHDFNHLKVEGRAGGTYFTLAVGGVSGRQVRGFACIVSKKAARKAVDRNRIKRRVREVLREFILSLPDPLVLVVYAKPGAARAGMHGIREDLTVLANRLRLPPGGTG